MTKALPFTEASISRLMKAAEKAGKFVVGIKADGTLIIGDKPVDLASFISEMSGPRTFDLCVLPAAEEDAPIAVRRFGEKLNGGHGAS